MEKSKYLKLVEEGKISKGTVLKVVPNSNCNFPPCKVVVLDTELTCDLDEGWTTELHYKYSLKNLVIVRDINDTHVDSIFCRGEYMVYHITYLELCDEEQ